MKTKINSFSDKYQGHRILVKVNTNHEVVRCDEPYCGCGKRQWFNSKNKFAFKHGLEW